MKINYNLSHRLITCILFLCLQSCTSFSNSPFSNSLTPRCEKEINDTLESNSLIRQLAMKPLIGKELHAEGGHLVIFYEENDELQAKVEINASLGFSKTYTNLPIYMGAEIIPAQLVNLDKGGQARVVEVKLSTNDQPGYVYIGKRGLVGGMKRTLVKKGDEDQEEEKGKGKVGKIDLSHLSGLLEYAKGGNCEAQFKLGQRAYEAWKHQRTKGAAYEARTWLDRAAAQGHDIAMSLLKELNVDSSFNKYPLPSEFVNEKEKSKKGRRRIKKKAVELTNIRELDTYFNNEYLEITSKNYKQLIEFSKKYKSSFASYKGGVFIKNYEKFNNLDGLTKLLSNFSKIKKFKIDCGKRNEVEVTKVVAPCIQFYADLVELYIFDCQLNEVMMQVIVESIPYPEKLKVINITGNNLDTLSDEVIALLQLKFSNAHIIESNPYQGEVITSLIPEIAPKDTDINNMGNFFLELEDQAQQGDADAQNKISIMYRGGLGVGKNYEKAFKWFQQAAKHGHADAQNNLAVMYANGEKTNKNYYKAFKWFHEAATQGHMDAQYNVGIMYKNGWGVDKNYRKAFKWFQQAAEWGHVAAQNNLGIMYGSGRGIAQNYEEAFRCFQHAAIQKSRDAQNNLGIMYKNGWGVGKNYKKAFKCFQQAADQGHADAQNNLGNIYKNGVGVISNYQEAIKWYQKAVEQGHVVAQYALGQLCEQGKGVKKDEEKAAEFYIQAAKHRYKKAAFSLRKLALKGNKLSQIWLIEEAEKGDREAQYTLGTIYEEGIGVEKNEEEAIEFYIQATKQGHLDATCSLIRLALQGNTLVHQLAIKKAEEGDQEIQYILGQMYKQGIGVPKDEEKAIKFYIKAANQGHKRAFYFISKLTVKGNKLGHKWLVKKAGKGDKEIQYLLGKIYEKGLGVEKDTKQAMRFYIQAAKQGYLNATYSLIKLAMQMEVVGHQLAIEKADEIDQEVQYAVGQIYEQGIGVQNDDDEAVEWYIKAANQKHKDAPNALSRLAMKGNSLAQKWVIKN